MLLPIDQFSVAALSSMAPLLLLLLHLVRMAEAVVPSALQEMRLKCAGTSEVKVTIDSSEMAKAKLGQAFEPWPQVDPCGAVPKTPSYILCNSASCASSCLKNLESQHIILHTDKQLPDASRALILKIAPNEYHPNFAQLGTCTLEQGMDGDGNASTDALRSFSKTSVLFVSISFIILMVISLAWLVFYYVQRFRYAHAKDRLQRRLFNAARKALTRIQTRTLRAGEAILDTDCAVCIDPYQIADVVRELPCKHVYHKSCIDPWLLEHRTCPMCKADIVKHFGYHVSSPVDMDLEENFQYIGIAHARPSNLSSNEGNRLEEGGARDAESPEPPSSGSESTAFPYQGSHDHDFHFTPTTSPQLVMSSSTAKSFAIVPLTVHAKNVPSTVSAPVEVEAGPSSRSERIISVGQVEPVAVRHASARASSQGQIVNLIQVRARAQSCTRSVPLRRAERPSSTRPAPIDTNQVV